jgi:hypothetical protein
LRKSVRFGRSAAHGWLALFALLLQIALPFGHSSLAEELGEECPGLELFDAHHGHDDADASGRAARHTDAHKHQLCPVCQSLTALTTLIAADAPVLPLPEFHATRPAVLAIGLAPPDEFFSRPRSRGPPLDS